MSSSEPRLPVDAGSQSVRADSVEESAKTSQAMTDSELKGQVSSEILVGDSPSRQTLPPLISSEEIVNEAPPWLISAGLHLLTLILLGLMIFSPRIRDDFSLQFGTAVDEDSLGEDIEVSLDLDNEGLDTALAPQPIPEIQQNPELTPELSQLPLTDEMPTVVDPIRMALTGREAGMRDSLLGAYGGTRGTQQAVMEGLRWLERVQGSKGLWSLTGPYKDGARAENEEAATGLALIAFQGAGYTPEGDPADSFTKATRRGWNALLMRQKRNGDFYNSGRSTGRLYTHAICTIAICELYGMTREAKYKDAAQRAVDFCVKTQAPEGGWRYIPRRDSDLSVTGWFVMALQSARMAGLTVPTPTLDNVTDFLNSVSRDGGSAYAYMPRDGATLSMTAEGLLCRQYLGWKHDDTRLQRGADTLIENLPRWTNSDRDVYYWYYATQVCHHMESQHWQKWNERMRRVIPENQVRDGRERGSWNPQGDRWAVSGGRLFSTCLSIYMLEVYYRHLPIYQLDLLDGTL